MMSPEEIEQAHLFTWALLEEHTYPELRWMYHIPNGGKRDIATARRLKVTGVKSGVSDVCLPVARGGYNGLYIEMKVKPNKPTKEQREFLDFVSSEGYATDVCYSCEAAIETIKKYLKGALA